MRRRKAAALVALLGFGLTGLTVAQEQGTDPRGLVEPGNGSTAAPAENVDPVRVPVEEAVRLYRSRVLLLESSKMHIVEQTDDIIRGTVTLDFHEQQVSFTSSMTRVNAILS